MLEVELKFALPQPERVIDQLNLWGAALAEERTDEDLYLAAPDRNLKTTDEVFRLRRIGTRNMLTYKGPKRGTATKTREEIEVPLGDGDDTAADATLMLTRLGYTAVALVRKSRRVFRFSREGFAVEACIDTLADVGTFIEIEILAAEDHLARAQAVVLAAAAELGLAQPEKRSYLSMVLAGRGQS